MSFAQFWDAAGGGGANVNLDNTYEPVGWNTDGSLTSISGNASANVPGTDQPLGTNTNAWAGFWLFMGPASSSSARFLIDISLDGGTTHPITNIYSEPSNTGFQAPIWCPINVPAGSSIKARARTSSGGLSIKIAMEGVVKNASSAPLWSTMTGINVDTTTTRAATSLSALSSSSSPTWTQLVASTSVAYGAIQLCYGSGTSTPALAQAAMVCAGIGGSGSEVEISRDSVWILASGQAVIHAVSHIIEKAVASGSRISAKITAATPGSDAIAVGVYGLA